MLKGMTDSDRILDMILKNSDRHLDAVLFRKAGYKKAGKKISGSLKNLQKENLTGRQNRAVDRVLTAYTEENAYCCKILYKQGFKDCVSLLKELGVLG